MKENPKGMPSKAKLANLNDIKVFSIEIQKYIHGACGNMANLLKMLDLKLKEIKLINTKIGTLATGKAAKKLSHKKLTAVKIKAKKLLKINKLTLHHTETAKTKSKTKSQSSMFS